jgi:ribosomal protein S18 acetylase RimI-like enzyme
MPQILDRPVWHALRSRQSEFAAGGPRALRYSCDVSPFAAAEDDGRPALDELAGLIPADCGVVLVQAGDCPLPPGTVAEIAAEGVQMVARAVDAPPPSPAVVDLAEADAPEMRALAALTKPGPFLQRTHELGGFVGIRQDGRLVAMAGERMKLPGFTEVSGVCTHPEARGRGYAGVLSAIVAGRILARGETPFLHVYAGNHAAIRVYESLGFEERSRMAVRFLRRA